MVARQLRHGLLAIAATRNAASCESSVDPRDERTPFVEDGPLVEHVERIWARNCRLSEQAHLGLSRAHSRLAVVAGDAGADHVLPNVGAVPRSRNDVVERELAGFLSAVLADESVAVEDCLTGKPAPHHRAFYHVDQPDD